jgi:desulfoferrodoxin (superoxide reductase-like protein)/DNA-binding XRE family transcriptional regulator
VDCIRVGKLILALRKEKGMTQRQLADEMNISDKTVSKWERGLGCPDVSLLGELSDILGVNIGKILAGDLEPNGANGGNMNRIQFFVCPTCGNVLFSTGEADISCCGRKLAMLTMTAGSANHSMSVEIIEEEYYITIDHEMTKNHYISFVAFVGYDRVLLVKLYPEQNAELRFPKMHGSKLFAYCNEHGLWENKI